jgi:hypothetical protein
MKTILEYRHGRMPVNFVGKFELLPMLDVVVPGYAHILCGIF